jgi:putative ABC transport system permease protein
MYWVAIRMLTADRGKYASLVIAIAFAAFLLSHQVSMFLGILDRTTSQIRDVVDADIWVMDPRTEYVDEVSGLEDQALIRVRGVAGVEWAAPLFKGYLTVRNGEGVFRNVIFLGVDDASLAGVPRKMLLGAVEDLKRPDAVIIDAAGFRSFFPGAPLDLGRRLEINDRRAVIAGISDASPPFQTFPVMVARYSGAMRYAGNGRKRLSFVLVKARAGTAVAEVCGAIERATGLKALSTDAFAGSTVGYYLKHTGIPANFGIVVLVAAVVGVVIAGQTFYIFTLEHLKQFAALKAMGVTNGTLGRMIFCQAAAAGVMGYSFGVAMTAGFFVGTGQVPDLRGFRSYGEVLVGTFIAIGIISGLASLLSLRKVTGVEPALVFRS